MKQMNLLDRRGRPGFLAVRMSEFKVAAAEKRIRADRRGEAKTATHDPYRARRGFIAIGTQDSEVRAFPKEEIRRIAGFD